MADKSAPLPDQAARERSLDVTRSFLVQAPAGAGKTELLTRRFLALLAKVERPEAILGLTFTKKAAAEMRERVLQALRGEAPEGKPHAPELRKLADAARRRDDEKKWRLLENPARLRLQTFDSFAASVTTQAPLASRLAGRKTEENAEPIYRQAALELLAELAGPESADTAAVRAALRRLLLHVDNDWPRLEGLLTAMLSRRDQWLRHSGSGQSDSETRKKLEASLQSVIAAALRAVRAAIPAELDAPLAELARYAAANRGEKSHPDLAAGQDLPALPGADPASLPVWRCLAAMFLTAKDEPLKSASVRQGFPAASSGVAAKEMKARWAEARDALSPQAAAALAALRHLPAASYSDAQWELLAALLRLLARAAAILDLQLRQAGAADFIAVQMAAQEALGPDDAPGEVAFAWDTRLEHLLVDEFQDTSLAQFEFLRRLTREWQPSDGRTLFLVGDPMQSIYGFRQAEVRSFLLLWEERRFGLLPIVPLQLSSNFRSAPLLTNWFNEPLAAAFPVVRDLSVGAVPYAPCHAAKADDTGAEVCFHCLPWLPDPDGTHGQVDRDAETAAIVQLITALRQAEESKDGDIAILVRIKQHAAAIVAALEALGVPVQSGLNALGDRPAVLDLLALTRALLRPADRIAWLAILRAPWCGLTLADLLAIADGDPEQAIWDNCQNDERRSRLSPAGRVALDRCRPVLAKALAAAGSQPLHRVVEGAWLALGGPAARRPGQEQGDWQDARAFLELLAGVEEAGDVDLDGLSERVAALKAAPVADPAAVKVMTIHDAKGLEFDTVILPGLDCRGANESKHLLEWRELSARDGAEPELLLAPLEAAGEEEATFRYLRKLGERQRQQELIRLIYVAATRAKRRLHLFAGWKLEKAPDKRSMARLLCPNGEPPPPAKQVAAAPPAAAVAPPAMLRRLTAAWRPEPLPPAVALPGPPPLGAPAPVRFQWVHPLARHIGVVVHAWLGAAAGQAAPAPWTAAGIRARLAQEGVADAELPAAAARVQQAMAQVLADPRGQWLLARHEDDRREWALAGVTAGAPPRHIRLDRSFIADGARWIVDYKTGTHEGGGMERFLQEEERRYRPQLETYAALLRAEETRPVRLALYFPLVLVIGRPVWRELEFGVAAAPGS